MLGPTGSFPTAPQGSGRPAGALLPCFSSAGSSLSLMLILAAHMNNSGLELNKKQGNKCLLNVPVFHDNSSHHSVTAVAGTAWVNTTLQHRVPRRFPRARSRLTTTLRAECQCPHLASETPTAAPKCHFSLSSQLLVRPKYTYVCMLLLSQQKT